MNADDKQVVADHRVRLDAEGMTPAEPDGTPRVVALDVLRGIAILAILFMNVDAMGGSLYVLMSGDVRHFGWTPADQAVWWLREVLANGTARALLEMLFGVGMVILTDRAAATLTGWRVLRAYWWRNVVLVLFGLVHVFVLLWPGDILHTYGLAALIAAPLRGLRPRLLIVFGLVLGTLQLVGGGIAAVAEQRQHAVTTALVAEQQGGRPLTIEQRKTLAAADARTAERAKQRAEDAALVAADDRARTGTALSWARSAWNGFAFMQARWLELFVVWEAASTMLIGAALYRLGVIQGARSRLFYQNLTAIAYAVGLTLRLIAAQAHVQVDGGLSVAEAASEISRLATTIGHIGLIHLALRTAAGTWLLRPFAAAGRTALSIYVGQTLICLWVLYPPWGLALYGRQGWVAFMGTALLVDLALLWLANWWVRRYAIAPVEWAWRSIVAGRRLPLRFAAGGERL